MASAAEVPKADLAGSAFHYPSRHPLLGVRKHLECQTWTATISRTTRGRTLSDNTDGTQPVSKRDGTAGKPTKKNGQGKFAKFFAVRRNQYITLIVSVLVIGGLITGGVVMAENTKQQQIAAEAVATKKAAEEEAAAEAERQEQLAAEAEEERLSLLETGATRVDEATTFLNDSASWGLPEGRIQLETAIQTLRTAIDDGKTLQLKKALDDVRKAETAVGTPEDAIDRQYDALVTANGKPGKVGQGQADCDRAMDGLVYDPADPIKLADYWVEYPYNRIDEAVQFYCPELQPSVDIANKSFADGSWIAGQRFPAGTYKTVGSVSNCYWARTDGSGGIIDNNFINSALNGVTVTVRPGEQFETRGCGIWRQQ